MRCENSWMKTIAAAHCLISLLPLQSVQTLPVAKRGGHLSHVQAYLFSPF
jgi:hypothetical protein